MDHSNLNQYRSIEELAAHQTEVRARLTELNLEFSGLPFPEEARDEFANLKEEDTEIGRRITELEGRMLVIDELNGREGNRETLSFQTARPGATRDSDIYDLSTMTVDMMNPARGMGEMRDRALRSIDTSTFPSERQTAQRTGFTQEDLKGRVKGLLEQDGPNGDVAQRILLTGSPTYKRAFAKAISGRQTNREEQDALSRAASLTTTAGGFAVPFTLDPTVILTNNGVINPVRGIANVITITGNEWRGVSSAGITASYGAEASAATDNAPTLAQPTANVELAKAFVPFSFEIGDDWGSFQSEMGRLFADAKDILESNKFLRGLGHGSTEPEGLLVGANNGTVLTATASVLAVADLYAVENALAPRWRSRATWTGGKAAYQKIRQFDTGGGASLWTQLRFGDPADLIGYAAYEWSEYATSTTVPNNTVLTLGDYNQFSVIDRVGMSVELVPHLMTSYLPNGQRGLLAWWRNTSDVVTAAAFRHVRIS